ncbi:MAG: cytochrome c [Rhodospirillaceae bacterium]|nr:MAG: cytochrome c [Rhodospirillaceae bacterium]
MKVKVEMNSTLLVIVALGGSIIAHQSAMAAPPDAGTPKVPASSASSSSPVIGDPKVGAAIAQRSCASCHALGGARIVSDKAPNLAVVAHDPSRTPAYFRGFLSKPHPRMPPLPLTTLEIENLVAYLDQLGRMPLQ